MNTTYAQSLPSELLIAAMKNLVLLVGFNKPNFFMRTTDGLCAT